MMMMMMTMMNHFCGITDRRHAFSLIPSGTIVRDSHHRKFLTRCEQDLLNEESSDFVG